MSHSPVSTSTSSLSQIEIETRTRTALTEFDSNMAGIFDRASFYANDLYASIESNPTLTKAQTCFKYTLFATNLLFLIFGIVLMAVGSYAMNNKVSSLSGTTLPTGLIVLGVFIMVLSAIGGIAAYKENTMFLAVYFFFLLIFTIILFFVGIAVYVLKDKADQYMVDGWNSADDDVRGSLQTIFTCCALTQSYVNGTMVPDEPYPGVCPPACDTCPSSGPGAILPPPCRSTIVSTFQKSVTTAGACGIAFSILMMAGLVIVCFLMQGIKKKKAQLEIVQLRETMPDTLTDEPIL